MNNYGILYMLLIQITSFVFSIPPLQDTPREHRSPHKGTA